MAAHRAIRNAAFLTNTEGATAPDLYAELVGQSADAMLAVQTGWRAR